MITSFRPSCERVADLARRTDSNSPADWLFIASRDLEGVRELASRELAFAMCVSKLAEILEKIIKAELIRTGWFLVKTHDLVRLVDELCDGIRCWPTGSSRFAKSSRSVISPTDTPASTSRMRTGPGFAAKPTRLPGLLETVNKRVETSS